MENINLAFSGDLVLQELDKDKVILNDFVDVLHKCNANLCINLESPFILPDFKRVKNKITLYSYESELSILSSLSPYMVNLSNNHINDYGDEGGRYTIELLTRNSIKQFGIGYEGAKNNVKVEELFILLAYTSKSADFSGELLFATADTLGPYDVDFEQIEYFRLKYPDKAIVVNIHWGIEDITYPEYEKRLLGRKIIDSGADIIIGHHSHIVQPYEVYKGSYIFYSLGNFIFADINYNVKGREYFKKSKSHQLKGITPIIKFSRNREVEVINVICTKLTSSGRLICKNIDVNDLKKLSIDLALYQRFNYVYVFIYDNLLPKARIIINNPSIIKNKIKRVFGLK